MKKLLLLLLLSINCSAQNLDFGDTEYTSFSVTFEPFSSVKEESINATFEFQYVPSWFYLKPSIQILPSINYIDTAVGVGIILDKGYTPDWIYYGGIRGGFIHRKNNSYPIFGWEAGIKQKIAGNFYLGARFTLDWRTDFDFSGADAKYQGNGGVEATFIFD